MKFRIRNYLDTTNELLYDTRNTVPGGALYLDYPLTFNMNLKNMTKYTLKYKVLDVYEKKPFDEYINA